MDNFWKLEDYQKDWLMENQILNRFKSFGWRLLVATITFILAWITENIGLLELPLWLQAMLGTIILPEITKYWAVKQNLKGKTFFGSIKRPKEDDRV